MKFDRRLSLNHRQYTELLDHMEAKNRSLAFETARLYTRHPFRIPTIPLCVEQPDGGKGRFMVYGRNLSQGGISIIHGGFLHQGSECKLVLRAEGADMLAVSGVVRHCHLIEGFSHEIGIQFLEEIEPGLFLGEDIDANLRVGTPKPGIAQGNVLVVEPYEPDRILFEHQLRSLNYNPIAVASSGAALDVIKGDRVDLVLSGLDLLKEHGVYFVQMLRQMQFRNPVLLMSADSHPDTLAIVSQVGADDLLVKPLDPQLLAAQLEVHLGTKIPRGSLLSQLQAKPGMKPLIVRFVNTLRRSIHLLRRAYASMDMVTVREICCQIKGSALTYGFPALTVIAFRALRAIDRHGDSIETRQAILELIDCADRVQAPTMTSAAVQSLTPELLGNT